MVYLFLGMEEVIRIKKVFDEVTGAKDYPCGLVVGDVKEGEAPAGRGVFSVVDDGYGKAFGCFKVRP